ncbi:MerR family transcriptional regulator [Streptomyces ovatisporus]|uniref:MerR family transcriptional regulator n=1 Tax=Streptomyces ovatisporus TaxID=1128682 RepID=A0ABV9A3K6_9ACTN
MTEEQEGPGPSYGGEDRALRPVDLARAAGVSAQQVRNYETSGILPPVPRTASGYRRFSPTHLAALLTYRSLNEGYGPGTARAVMQAVQGGDVPLALALIDEGHAALHEQRLSLDAASRALEALARQQPDGRAVPRLGLRIGELADRLGVRTSALRVWESAGLLSPQREPGTSYRRFGPADVRDARLVLTLRQSHYPLPRIRTVLDGLRESGSTEALRTAVAQRRTELTRRATAMLEASGRLHRYVTEERFRQGAASQEPTRARAL